MASSPSGSKSSKFKVQSSKPRARAGMSFSCFMGGAKAYERLPLDLAASPAKNQDIPGQAGGYHQQAARFEKFQVQSSKARADMNFSSFTGKPWAHA
jgi:hypothetical protein